MLRSIRLRTTGAKAAALWTIFLLLLLSACSEEQKQAPTTPVVQEQAVEPAALEKVKEAAAEGVEKAKVKVDKARDAVEKAMDSAARQSAEAVKNSKQALEQASTTAKESVSDVASRGMEKTKAAIAPTMDKANQVVATSTQQSSAIGTGLAEEGKGSVDEAASAVPPSAAPADIIILENKFGRVTLTHAFHGETYGCTPCHGDATPGPFELTKDLAHSTMCKDCHKSSGGPTGCTECHIK